MQIIARSCVSRARQASPSPELRTPTFLLSFHSALRNSGFSFFFFFLSFHFYSYVTSPHLNDRFRMRRAVRFAYYTARFFSRFLLLAARIPREFFLGEMSPPASPFPPPPPSPRSPFLVRSSFCLLRSFAFVNSTIYLRALSLGLLTALLLYNEIRQTFAFLESSI